MINSGILVLRKSIQHFTFQWLSCDGPACMLGWVQNAASWGLRQPGPAQKSPRPVNICTTKPLEVQDSQKVGSWIPCETPCGTQTTSDEHQLTYYIETSPKLHPNLLRFRFQPQWWWHFTLNDCCSTSSSFGAFYVQEEVQFNFIYIASNYIIDKSYLLKSKLVQLEEKFPKKRKPTD